MARAYKNIRIFKSNFLESLTHVHPITPLVIWGPIGVFIIRMGGEHLDNKTILTLAFQALITWSFVEYGVHRFLFHFPAKSKIGQYFVFLFHGLHHDEPNDPTRLVMPPFPAFLLLTGFYLLFSLFFPFYERLVFLGFFLFGYLAYDYTHYAIHHFPMKSRIGKYLKKHHIGHHNRFHNRKFGVTTPLWDHLLGTYHPPKK